MNFSDITACWVICGSFCSLKEVFHEASILREAGVKLIPVISYSIAETDSRFGASCDIINEIEKICKREVIQTIAEAEPLGPKIKTDITIISPCTGNTLAKLASGITDTPATMAVKATLRSDHPAVIALASNDALAANLKNIAALLVRKNIFFVPMKQDDPEKKPHSLIADFTLLPETINSAFSGKQIRPLFL